MWLSNTGWQIEVYELLFQIDSQGDSAHSLLFVQTGFALNLALPEDDGFFDDKADILEINGFPESHEFVLTSREEPSAELLAFLRLINLSGMPPHKILLYAFHVQTSGA